MEADHDPGAAAIVGVRHQLELTRVGATERDAQVGQRAVHERGVSDTSGEGLQLVGIAPAGVDVDGLEAVSQPGDASGAIQPIHPRIVPDLTTGAILGRMFDDKPHVRARLDEAVVIWLTTVTPDGQPQSSPVWFIVEGDELLVFSRANVPRIRNVSLNGHVALNLDTLDEGEEVLTMEAEARIDATAHPASEVSAYLAKYGARIAGHGWTTDSFALDYPISLRIRPTRLRAS